MHKRKEGPAKGMKEQMDTFSPNETWAWFLARFFAMRRAISSKWSMLTAPQRCKARLF